VRREDSTPLAMSGGRQQRTEVEPVARVRTAGGGPHRTDRRQRAEIR